MSAPARRKDDVIQIRTSAEAKALLNRAAALRGQKLSEFMLDSARRQAEETILDQPVHSVACNAGTVAQNSLSGATNGKDGTTGSIDVFTDPSRLRRSCDGPFFFAAAHCPISNRQRRDDMVIAENGMQRPRHDAAVLPMSRMRHCNLSRQQYENHCRQ